MVGISNFKEELPTMWPRYKTLLRYRGVTLSPLLSPHLVSVMDPCRIQRSQQDSITDLKSNYLLRLAINLLNKAAVQRYTASYLYKLIAR